MPAYNAQHTIEKTWREVVAHDVVDLVIVVDDASQDDTVKLARGLDRVIGARASEEPRLRRQSEDLLRSSRSSHGADIVVMVHPDYQYTPKLIPAMAGMVSSGLYALRAGVAHSRRRGARRRDAVWRYVANRFLTLAGNILLGTKVSEFHTGYRAFSRELLEALPLDANSDDFVFDNQMLAQAVWLGFQIGEVSCPTRYAPDASSINFVRSVKYGFGCLDTAAQFRLAKWGLLRSARFPVDRHLAYSTWRQRAN